jgi:hypothetical protein
MGCNKSAGGLDSYYFYIKEYIKSERKILTSLKIRIKYGHKAQEIICLKYYIYYTNRYSSWDSYGHM